MAGNPYDLKHYSGSIGLPVPSTDIRLVDDNGHDVPPGEPGELWVKGPQVMLGYWQRPEATDEVLKDGWLATGDVVTVDEQGFVRIVDRKKDMILVSGFNVYPNEIEGRGQPASEGAGMCGDRRAQRSLRRNGEDLRGEERRFADQGRAVDPLPSPPDRV